jgi:hypothetical protein
MKTTLLSLFLLLCISLHSTTQAQLKLNSYPTASATIYLDFDGEEINSPVWNGGTAFTCAPSAMSTNQITEVFERVSEDYRPFNLTITTDLAVFLAAPLNKRMRVVVTPTSGWFSGVGGVSYVGSFSWGDDTPSFVFCDRLGNNAKMVAECCSHESGHSVGLSHQSKYDGSCALTQPYNDGAGAGEVSWAPIMGNSYYRNMSGWNNGPTPYGCSYLQDNLSIITTQNGFSYRTDDYTDDMNTTPAAINVNGININGLINTSVDKDVVAVNVGENTSLYLQVNPYSIAANNEGADLDVKLSIYDSAKNLVRVYNPANTMSVVVDTFLAAGKYYLVVEGTGNNNATDYGSLGSYSLKGLSGILPIKKITLSGSTVNNTHKLNWNIDTDEMLTSIVVEASTDAINFTSIKVAATTQTQFDNMPTIQHTFYYRIKVITGNNTVAYSNIISLKAIEKTAQIFTVTTAPHQDIVINAPTVFQYRILSINGTAIAYGNGTAGYNKVTIAQQPSGMYLLQLVSNKGSQTERIIKQ